MKKYSIEIKWGVIFMAVTLAWMLIENITGLHGAHIDKHAIYTNIFAIPAIAVYVFALLEKRKKDLGGVMTWKQGFISGLIITIIVGILSPLGQVIIHNVISPEYFPNVIEFVVSEGQMAQADAEEYFSLSNYIMQSVIGALIMGLLTSAIVAFFVKKG